MGPDDAASGDAETSDQANRFSCLSSSVVDGAAETTSEPCRTVHHVAIGGARDGRESDSWTAMREVGADEDGIEAAGEETVTLTL